MRVTSARPTSRAQVWAVVAATVLAAPPLPGTPALAGAVAQAQPATETRLGAVLNEVDALVAQDTEEGYVRALALLDAEAVPLAPRATDQDAWIGVQERRALVSTQLADFQTFETASATVLEAIATYRAVLEVRNRETDHASWVLTMRRYGEALSQYGDMLTGEARAPWLEQSQTALVGALWGVDPMTDPDGWGVTQSLILQVIKLRFIDATTIEQQGALFDDARERFEASTTALNRERNPVGWGLMHLEMGRLLLTVSDRQDAAAARGTRTDALRVLDSGAMADTRSIQPGLWALTRMWQDVTRVELAESARGPERTDLIAESMAASRAAGGMLSPQSSPLNRALVNTSLARALLLDRDDTPRAVPDARLSEAANLAADARDAISIDDDPALHATALVALGKAQAGLAGEATGDERRALLDTAVGTLLAVALQADGANMSDLHARASLALADVGVEIARVETAAKARLALEGASMRYNDLLSHYRDNGDRSGVARAHEGLARIGLVEFGLDNDQRLLDLASRHVDGAIAILADLDDARRLAITQALADEIRQARARQTAGP
jgi:hypothetical protein